ncbi:uncharacterized [Tachysurus ichikawai]
MQANPKEHGALGVLINGALSCLPAKTPETNGVKLVAIRHRVPSLLPANQLPLVVCECVKAKHDSAPGSPFMTSHGTYPSFPIFSLFTAIRPDSGKQLCKESPVHKEQPSRPVCEIFAASLSVGGNKAV